MVSKASELLPDAADHRQLAVRYLTGDVLQVVCPRAADDDGVIQGKGTGMKNHAAAFQLPQRGSGHKQPFSL
jgi:hypothetical protein